MGERTERKMEQAREKEAQAQRFTSLDRTLKRYMDEQPVIDVSPDVQIGWRRSIGRCDCAFKDGTSKRIGATTAARSYMRSFAGCWKRRPRPRSDLECPVWRGCCFTAWPLKLDYKRQSCAV